MSELTAEQIACALSSLVELARKEFGETQWRYSKKQVTWSRFRNRPGSHFVPCGEGDEVTQAEYDANIAESKRLEVEAFMGRCKHSYVRYDKNIAVPGWRERLVEMIREYV